jgi:DNA-binding PadR family transcriptional regulator
MVVALASGRRARENRTRYVVLGMLMEEPLTGYALRQRIAGSVGHFWSESFGQLYPTLRQLAAEGLVEAKAARRGPGRAGATYAVTPRGKGVLAAWVAQPPAIEPMRNELLLKVFFGGAVTPDVTARNLEAIAARIRAQRAVLEGVARGFDAQASCHADAPYWKLTLEFGLRFMRTALEWIDHALGVVRAQPPRARGAAAARSAGSVAPRPARARHGGNR